ncbi:MAG: glycerophosphodiester phosphodiesterase [Rubripirellula sp.]
MFATRLLLLLCLTLGVLHNDGWGQMIVAHRGASHDAPENTVAAFKLAWEQGSDGIEGDFYLTSDDQIVCIHDRDTERTAGSKRVVEDSTLAELRTLEYGGWKGTEWQGELIPTFRQVLATIPAGKLFVIELKSKKAIAPVLAAELAKLDTESIELLIISFDLETVKACRELMPEVRAHWLTKFTDKQKSGEFRPSAAEVAKAIRQCGAAGVGMQGNRNVIDEAYIDALRTEGCDQFHVWTIDSIDDAAYFQDLGAIGITTNRPQFIRDAIREPALR